MYHSQLFYGLKPMGPHRALVAKLFATAVESCPACDGDGAITLGEDDPYTPCRWCAGTGRMATRSPEEFEALRQRVLKEFPDAGVDPENR